MYAFAVVADERFWRLGSALESLSMHVVRCQCDMLRHIKILMTVANHGNFTEYKY
jgi:hypothetical protein